MSEMVVTEDGSVFMEQANLSNRSRLVGLNGSLSSTQVGVHAGKYGDAMSMAEDCSNVMRTIKSNDKYWQQHIYYPSSMVGAVTEIFEGSSAQNGTYRVSAILTPQGDMESVASKGMSDTDIGGINRPLFKQKETVTSNSQGIVLIGNNWLEENSIDLLRYDSVINLEETKAWNAIQMRGAQYVDYYCYGTNTYLQLNTRKIIKKIEGQYYETEGEQYLELSGGPETAGVCFTFIASDSIDGVDIATGLEVVSTKLENAKVTWKKEIKIDRGLVIRQVYFQTGSIDPNETWKIPYYPTGNGSWYNIQVEQVW